MLRYEIGRFDPGSGRSLEGGDGNPLQYSCLENPMHSGTWWAMVHRVAESVTTEVTQHTCVLYTMYSQSDFSFMEMLFLVASLAFLC